MLMPCKGGIHVFDLSSRPFPRKTRGPRLRRAAWIRLAALALALMLASACALAETAPDGFTFSGGSGKVTITCDAIWESEGQTLARIVFSSPNYPTLQSEGVTYEAAHEGKTSIFVIPVHLNQDMEVVGTTTAMSTPHDITYTIRVSVGEDAPEAEPAEAAEAAAPEPVSDKAPVEGLQWLRRMPLTYAEGFSVDYYEGGYVLIDIVDGDRVMILPDGAEAPANLPGDVLAIHRPRRIYLAATSAMALLARLDALDGIAASSLEAQDWSVEEARAAMEAGEMTFAGKYSEPDYELLIQLGCDLAVESTMIFHTPKVKEMLENLGIPVIVDRASYEPHPLGRTEWIKLYAAMVGREDAAEAFFSEKEALIEQYAGYPNSEKTVAFFYMSSDGSVVVRNSTDYVPKMIEIAGGRYALKDIVDPDSSRSSVSTTMEQFYAAAVDADYLIYNTSIASPLGSLDDLYALSPLFKDFKAVQAGNVYCAGKDLYQETDDVGELIADIHNMISGEGEMRFLVRLE